MSLQDWKLDQVAKRWVFRKGPGFVSFNGGRFHAFWQDKSIAHSLTPDEFYQQKAKDLHAEQGKKPEERNDSKIAGLRQMIDFWLLAATKEQARKDALQSEEQRMLMLVEQAHERQALPEGIEYREGS